jgi:hypothetical protein
VFVRAKLVFGFVRPEIYFASFFYRVLMRFAYREVPGRARLDFTTGEAHDDLQREVSELVERLLQGTISVVPWRLGAPPA